VEESCRSMPPRRSIIREVAPASRPPETLLCPRGRSRRARGKTPLAPTASQTPSCRHGSRPRLGSGPPPVRVGEPDFPVPQRGSRKWSAIRPSTVRTSARKWALRRKYGRAPSERPISLEQHAPIES
jgi:hypothetical protein